MTRAAHLLLLSIVVALLSCGAWSSRMSTYSGNDLFEASFTLPDDSAPPDGAQVNPPLEALGDRTKYLYNRLKPFLQGGGSSPAFVADYDAGVIASVTGPGGGLPIGTAATSGSYTDMLANASVTSDARVGDIALTFVSGTVVVAMGGVGGQANLKVRSKQGAAAVADVAPVPGATIYCPVSTDNGRAVAFAMLAWDGITTAGSYETTISGQVLGNMTSAQLWATITAVTVILRPAPNP